MLSSPYPVPRDRVWHALMVVAWGAGVAGGAWVLVYPPRSYEGLGLGLSLLWGALLGVGSLAVLAGHLMRRHRVELAGLWPALGGVLLYAGLSWESVFVGSPGSGARACMIVLLACLVAARIRQLRNIERRVKGIDRMGRSG